MIKMAKVFIRHNPDLTREEVIEIFKKKVPNYEINFNKKKEKRLIVKNNPFINVIVKLEQKLDQTYFDLELDLSTISFLVFLVWIIPFGIFGGMIGMGIGTGTFYIVGGAFGGMIGGGIGAGTFYIVAYFIGPYKKLSDEIIKLIKNSPEFHQEQ
jgi:hypothetical protein